VSNFFWIIVFVIFIFFFNAYKNQKSREARRFERLPRAKLEKSSATPVEPTFNDEKSSLVDRQQVKEINDNSGILSHYDYVAESQFDLFKKEKGNQGERYVSSILKTGLDPESYFVLNDILIPSGNATTQIDHVVLSNFGIFVVETKNMGGWIFGNESQSKWTQSMPGARKFSFQNPLRQNYKHTKALSVLLKINHDLFHSIVFFVGSAEMKTGTPSNVMSEGLIDYIHNKNKVIFSNEKIIKVKNLLVESVIENSDSNIRNHVWNLKEKHGV
jgi:hypothetical protein